MNKKKWIKTFQFLAAYLVAAWTFLQFVDWTLIRYNISPYWVDVLLWIFVGIIPSLLIYLYNQERINQRILKLREKIIFPLNIIILVIALYFGFGNSDLGATTKDITYENSDGQMETKTITKEEFRVGIPIFAFEQISQDSSLAWMEYGIGRILNEDLLQNKNLSPDHMNLSSTTDKIREASLFYDFYVDGEYQKVGDTYEITAHIRKATNGKSIQSQTFKGDNVLHVLDEVSVFITAEAGFVEGNSLNYVDLPIDEFMTNSLPAMKAFVQGNYSKAYDIDKNFALAYLENAKRNSFYNRGKLETQDIIDKAFALKNKLPLQKQLEVYIQRSLAYNQYEEAERQVNLQLEVDPSNEFYNQVLFGIYGDTKNLEAYLKKSEELFERDPKAENGMNLAQATMAYGAEETLLEALKPYEIISPEIKKLKLAPLILTGKITEAEKVLEEFRLQNSTNNWRNDRLLVYDSIINFYKTRQPDPNDYNHFVGEYRSAENEQTLEFFLEDGKIIQHASHQRMQRMIPVGPNAVGGGYVNNTTWKMDLVMNDSTQKPIGILNNSYFWNGINKFWYWKLDETIIAADEAFDKGDFDLADELYEKALQQNPGHSYIRHIRAHLNYIKTKSSEEIYEQNKTYAGNYGARRFWLKDSVFYYKRKGENVDLPKVKLLAISDSTYMYRSKLGTYMQFEEHSSGKLASVPYSFNGEKQEWVRLDGETNYLLKDD